jgi:hypothetical protein
MITKLRMKTTYLVYNGSRLNSGAHDVIRNQLFRVCTNLSVALEESAVRDVHQDTCRIIEVSAVRCVRHAILCTPVALEESAVRDVHQDACRIIEV